MTGVQCHTVSFLRKGEFRGRLQGDKLLVRFHSVGRRGAVVGRAFAIRLLHLVKVVKGENEPTLFVNNKPGREDLVILISSFRQVPHHDPHEPSLVSKTREWDQGIRILFRSWESASSRV